MTSTAPVSTVAEIDLQHHWHPYTDMAAYPADQFVAVAGDGPYLIDDAGDRYLDAISGLWNMQLGHGRSELIDAARRQLETLAYTPLNGRTHEPAAQLAQRLSGLTDGDLNRVFFATGGAEAVETAIKMVRQYWQHVGRPRRYKIVGMEGGWHGCTLGALGVSGVPEEKVPFEPLAPGFVRFLPPEGALNGTAPAGTVAAALERVLAQEDPETVGAVFAEPVLGLAGMIAPDPSYWREIQSVCDRHGLLFVADEVAMGFGRTGRMFSFQHYDLRPDLVTCAKGITAGYLPLSAVLVSDRVFEPFSLPGRAFSHGYTWGGHPVACAVALATLDVIESERLCERAGELGDRLRRRLLAGLSDLASLVEVRSLGLALAVQLDPDRCPPGPGTVAARICRVLRQDHHVLARPVGAGDAVPLLPPLTLTDEVADQMADAYVDAIRKVVLPS